MVWLMELCPTILRHLGAGPATTTLNIGTKTHVRRHYTRYIFCNVGHTNFESYPSRSGFHVRNVMVLKLTNLSLGQRSRSESPYYYVVMLLVVLGGKIFGMMVNVDVLGPTMLNNVCVAMLPDIISEF